MVRRRWLSLALLLALAVPGLFGAVRFPLPLGARRRSVQAEDRAPSGDPPASAEATPPGEQAPGEQTTSGKSFRRRLWGMASWAIYIGIIVLAIVFTPRILSWALDTPYPMAAVTSSSMWPTLKEGDIVLLKGVDKPEDLEVGNIIGFELDDGGFAIHRIVRIEGERITTKGDANREEDPVISFDRVIGYVPKLGGRLAKIPYLGNLSILLGPLFGSKTSDIGTLAQPVFDGGAGQQQQQPSQPEGPIDPIGG